MDIIFVVLYVLGVAETVYGTDSRCRNSRSDCNILATRGWCNKNNIASKCKVACGVCKKKQPPPKISNESQKQLKQSQASCVDKMIGCHVLAQRGWCHYRADRMKVKCRRTCSFCGTKPVGYVHSVPMGACMDKSKSCTMMKSRGWCKHRKAQMKTECRKTCHFCGPTCEDKRHDCSGLKRIGFCTKRPGQMYKMCKKTCRLCRNTETNEIEVSPTVSSGCVDTFGQKRCEYYAHIGMCTKNPKFKKICHNTCVCNFQNRPEPKHCKLSKHGCCWDNKTTKRDTYGTDCPVCQDDPRFEVLCHRFGEDCEGSGGLAQSVRRHCPKTCNFC